MWFSELRDPFLHAPSHAPAHPTHSSLPCGSHASKYNHAQPTPRARLTAPQVTHRHSLTPACAPPLLRSAVHLARPHPHQIRLRPSGPALPQTRPSLRLTTPILTFLPSPAQTRPILRPIFSYLPPRPRPHRIPNLHLVSSQTWPRPSACAPPPPQAGPLSLLLLPWACPFFRPRPAPQPRDQPHPAPTCPGSVPAPPIHRQHALSAQKGLHFRLGSAPHARAPPQSRTPSPGPALDPPSA